MFDFLQNLSKADKIQTAYQIKLFCERLPVTFGDYESVKLLSKEIEYGEQIIDEILTRRGKKDIYQLDEEEGREIVSTVSLWLQMDVLWEGKTDSDIENALNLLAKWREENNSGEDLSSSVIRNVPERQDNTLRLTCGERG